MNCLEKNCKDLENKCQVLSHVVREKQATIELEGAATKVRCNTVSTNHHARSGMGIN